MKKITEITRRKFVKTATIFTLGFAFLGARRLFGKSIEKETELAYNSATSVFSGNLDASWLTLAYVINGIEVNGSYETFYANKKIINTFIQDNRSHYRSTELAMLSIAYAMSGFDDDLATIQRDAKEVSGETVSGLWLTMASVLNRNETPSKLYGCLNYDESNLPTAITSLAYSASGLDSSVKDLFFTLKNITIGDIDRSWLTLAHVAGDAIDNEKKQIKLKNFFLDNKHYGTLASSMLTLAYAINNYEDITQQYYTYKNKTGKILSATLSGAILTIAYAVAKNPNNKIFSRHK